LSFSFNKMFSNTDGYLLHYFLNRFTLLFQMINHLILGGGRGANLQPPRLI